MGEDGLPTLFFASPAEWEEWLEKNHALSDGIWIKIAKKDADIESVRYPEVLESALCFGWIDARRQALDRHHFLQRFTPRRPRSKWSRINRETAERLIAHGRMRPAGLTEVARAKADGRWEAAYTGQRQSAVPDDLQRELDERPKAKAFFAQLSSQNRYAILYRLQDAKRPETRARRLEHQTVFADGRVPATFTQTGKVVAVPLEDPSLPSYTGQVTIWGGFNANGTTVNGTFTFNVRLVGSDGSTVTNHQVDHFNVRPDGSVNEFFHCH